MTSTVLYTGDLRTYCTHRQSSSGFETDAPVDNQGKGERFSPTDLLATSLATCMLTVMGIKAKSMNLDLKGMKADVEKKMKADPRRVGGINLTFFIPEQLRTLSQN
ncbi:MAG: OsmC family protein, partial [Flavisolibacter sp.]|nr:OsmC family protein [Flavisolibacter sp.]